MKFLVPILLVLCFRLAAGELEEVEQLFEQGRFEECDTLIENALQANPPEDQRVKLQAIREYIWGNHPEKITENVKKAREIAGHRGWLTADLLNHSSLLIRRAGDWKARGIPEYQDLSNAAAELLKQLKDGGNPEIAIQQVILQTKNHNLNGEYREPIKLIRNVLQLYYPSRRQASKKKSSAEIELLILLGEQYAGLGTATRNEREKIDFLSTASRYYLQAVKELPENSPRFSDLCDRLCLCRETLRLLGYNLQLPRQIKPRTSIEAAMIDEMFRARRFYDVAMALEKQTSSAMRLRYATALAATGQADQALNVLQELEEIPEPHWLLQMGKYAVACGQKAEAGVFLQRFLETVPQGLEALVATQQYATILIEQKRYADGAKVLLRQAELFSGQNQKNIALLSAAQCFYQAECYADCIAVLSRIPPTVDSQWLLAQVKIKENDLGNALELLNELLQDKHLTGELRRQVAHLAIFCAMKLDAPDTETLLELFIELYPDDTATPVYAHHLLKLYQATKAKPEKFEKLAVCFFAIAPSPHEATAFLAACAARIPNASSREELFRLLLKRESISPAELNILLWEIPSHELKREFLKRYLKPFANTPELCQLYLQIAEMEFEAGNYPQALKHLGLLLEQTEVFQYKRCKKLQIACYVQLNQETDVRKCCQELLLTSLEAREKRSIVLVLAQSWKRSQEPARAIAIAWSAVPLAGERFAREDEQIICDLLELIIDQAKIIQSEVDIREANDMLQLYAPAPSSPATVQL